MASAFHATQRNFTKSHFNVYNLHVKVEIFIHM